MGQIMDDLVNRLLKWANGGREAPQRVLVYPTNTCNLKCVFCYQRLDPYDFSDIMPKSKWVALTEELCRMGVQTVQISGGGEPMLASGTVLEMMKIIKQNGVIGRLVTNGTAVDAALAEKIISTGWDNVIFSIDGANAETHDFMRGVPGSFDKTVKGISHFRDIKEQRNTEKPLLEFSSVLCKKNYRQIEGVIRLAHDTGAKVITFEPVFVSNPYVHEIKMDETQRIEFMTKIIPPAIRLSESLGIITNLKTLIDLKVVEKTGDLRGEILKEEKKESTGQGASNPFFDLPCFEPWCWPKIEANGDVGPCSSNIVDGANLKGRSFADVWYGREFRDFRKAIAEGRLPDGCANCVSTHVPMNKRIRNELVRHAPADNQHF
ncbi:MAG: radical SAM protein [archaeon]